MSGAEGPGVLIVGASSAIATHVGRAYADRHARLHLVGRSAAKLSALREDLIERGAATVTSTVLDLTDYAGHGALVEEAVSALGRVDRVLIAHGMLPDQRLCESDPAEALRAFEVNCLSAVSLLTLVANLLEAQGSGALAVIGSVAGDRGRQSNYVYGATKGALEIFTEGLRNRLFSKGVAVVLVKPGFVDTPMTAHLQKNPLFADPKVVGERIHRALESGAAEIYAPAYWRPVMVAIRLMPGALFNRLRL